MRPMPPTYGIYSTPSRKPASQVSGGPTVHLAKSIHFFVFAVRPAENAPATSEAPVAVFAMHAESTGPVSAVVVTPSPDAVQADVRDLREPGNVYMMPLLP